MRQPFLARCAIFHHTVNPPEEGIDETVFSDFKHALYPGHRFLGGCRRRGSDQLGARRDLAGFSPDWFGILANRIQRGDRGWRPAGDDGQPGSGGMGHSRFEGNVGRFRRGFRSEGDFRNLRGQAFRRWFEPPGHTETGRRGLALTLQRAAASQASPPQDRHLRRPRLHRGHRYPSRPIPTMLSTWNFRTTRRGFASPAL